MNVTYFFNSIHFFRSKGGNSGYEIESIHSCSGIWIDSVEYTIQLLIETTSKNMQKKKMVSTIPLKFRLWAVNFRISEKFEATPTKSWQLNDKVQSCVSIN